MEQDDLKRLMQEANRLSKIDEEMKKALKGLDLGERLRSQMSGISDAFKAIRAPTLPSFDELRIPDRDIGPIARPPLPEETNSFQSAAVLIRRLAAAVGQWRASLPEGTEPAVLAILHGGIQINVRLLAQESFHGIRIEGDVDGSPCVLLAHQSTVQLLCYVRKVEPEQPRRGIGFIINGERTEA